MTEEERFDQMEKLGDAYAAAQATADHLKEFRKSKVALLMREAQLNGVQHSTTQERDALMHPEYIALLHGLKEATETAISAKWRLEVARMRFEAWRTKAANRRAEMNLR